MPLDTRQRNVRERLRRGLDELGLAPAADVINKLLAYVDLLMRWNRAYNLTAVREPAQVVTRHLLDSLAVAPFLPASARRLVDVGSGAGLPGVPLALMEPGRHFDLVDGNGKKTRFLLQAKAELGLANVAVQRVRAEAWAPAWRHDVVLSRALAPLAGMLDQCGHLCAATGCIMAWKGICSEHELAAVAGRCEVRAVYPLQVPGLNEARHVVCLGPPVADSAASGRDGVPHPVRSGLPTVAPGVFRAANGGAAGVQRAPRGGEVAQWR